MDGSESMKVPKDFADMGGDMGGDMGDIGGEVDVGDEGMPTAEKRCARFLFPGEDIIGVLGIPWLDNGRKNLLFCVLVDEAEAGGD